MVFRYRPPRASVLETSFASTTLPWSFKTFVKVDLDALDAVGIAATILFEFDLLFAALKNEPVISPKAVIGWIANAATAAI